MITSAWGIVTIYNNGYWGTTLGNRYVEGKGELLFATKSHIPHFISFS